VAPTGAHAGVLLLDGYQEMEFWYPVLRFREEGIRVSVIGRDEHTTFSRLGYPVIAEVPWSAAPSDCTLLVVPGEQAATESATLEHATATLRAARARGATIAAIGAGVGLVGTAGLLAGVRVAAPAHLKATLAAQGASVTELGVCADRGVLTARGPDDLPEFFRALLTTTRTPS
jgi:protease I